LVWAPANTAVDNLRDKPEKIGSRTSVRVNARARERQEPREKNKHLSLHRMVLEQHPELRPLYQTRKLRPEERKRLACLRRSIENKIISYADIVCCTCSAAGDDRIACMKYSALLVDECGQATEPESLIPISLTKGKVVLVGDQEQLGPIVSCQEAGKLGLDVSLFQRLVELKEKTIKDTGISFVRLNIQYRMHPVISQFPSLTFYEDSLEDGVTVEERKCLKYCFPWPEKDIPIMFLSCPDGVEEQTGTSYHNQEEACLVKTIVSYFVKNGVKAKNIGVITPYAGQNTLLGTTGFKMPEEVEVNSVDGFQGREKQLIVFSCVRSDKEYEKNTKIGFLRDRRRLNVALTRATSGLVVIGNPLVLRKDPLWRSFLLHCQRLNVLVKLDEKNRLVEYPVDLNGRFPKYHAMTSEDEKVDLNDLTNMINNMNPFN